MSQPNSGWRYAIYWLGTTMEGQSGDCIVVNWQSPQDIEKTYVAVIDGGNGDADWDGDLSRLMRTLREDVGSTHIDYLIGTHPDVDHISNFSDLIEQEDVTVGEIWMHRPGLHLDAFPEHTAQAEPPQPSAPDPEFAAIGNVRSTEQSAQDAGVHQIHPEPGTSTVDGVLTVVGPSVGYYRELLPMIFEYGDVVTIAASAALPKGVPTLPPHHAGLSLDIKENWENDQLSGSPTNGKKGASNNSSLIIVMQLPNDRQALFSGDAGTEAFKRAADDMTTHGFDPAKLRIFQLPHHGSWHSTDSETMNVLLGQPLGEVDARAKWEQGKHLAFVMAGSDDKHHPSQRVVNAAIRRGWRTPWADGGPIRLGDLARTSASRYQGKGEVASIDFDLDPEN